MIYPSIYSYNAPYRGPKESKELNKLFTSIVYDLSVAYEELEGQGSDIPTKLRFCISSDVNPKTNFPTAGEIDGSSFSYMGVNSVGRTLNQMGTRISQILENL